MMKIFWRQASGSSLSRRAKTTGEYDAALRRRKALTAIALLLLSSTSNRPCSVFWMRSRAALDEANVSRYANYLHKLTKIHNLLLLHTDAERWQRPIGCMASRCRKKRNLCTGIGKSDRRGTGSVRKERRWVRKRIFKRLVEGLTKTRNNIVSGIDSIFQRIFRNR